MPRRSDLKRVLVIGSGPIVIGQACEFDYSGTQACKALRSEGLEVILMNSNPATIMTDPDAADRTYVEPLTWEYARAVIEKERPDALLPTVGGQTALNLTIELGEHGVLEEFDVKLIGASLEAIRVQRTVLNSVMRWLRSILSVLRALMLDHLKMLSSSWIDLAFQSLFVLLLRWVVSVVALPTTWRNTESWRIVALN